MKAPRPRTIRKKPRPPKKTTPASWPDPHRFEDAIRRFEEEDRRRPPPSRAILLTGSSTITRWNDRLPVDLAPLTIIPRGFGGSTMNDLLFYADRVVFPYAPRAVVVYEGDNDLACGVSVARTHQAFRKLFALLDARLPEARVYVISVKPSPSRWHLWPRMRALNTRLRGDCDRDARYVFVDTASAMVDARGRPDATLFCEDGLHLSPRGYELWRQVLRTILIPEEEGRET